MNEFWSSIESHCLEYLMFVLCLSILNAESHALYRNKVKQFCLRDYETCVKIIPRMQIVTRLNQSSSIRYKVFSCLQSTATAATSLAM